MQLTISNYIGRRLPTLKQRFYRHHRSLLQHRNIRVLLLHKFRPLQKILKHHMSIPIIMFTNKIINPLQPPLHLHMLIRMYITLSNNRPHLRIQAILRAIRHLRPTFRHILRGILNVVKVINRLRHLTMRHISHKRNRLLRSHSHLHHNLIQLLFINRTRCYVRSIQ